MIKFIKINILPPIIYVVYKIYFKTISFLESAIPSELKNGCIYAHFHQDEMFLIERGRRLNLCVMTSASTDGEIMTKFLRFLGYRCVRGSPKRGGARALLELVRMVNDQKSSTALAVDGPRGPIYNVKLGIVLLAKKTGFPIVPVTGNLSRAYCFKNSWNKALLPGIFSTVRIHLGNHFYVPENADDKEMEKLRLRLENELIRIKKEAKSFY